MSHITCIHAISHFFYKGEKMLLVADETLLFPRILIIISAAFEVTFSVRPTKRENSLHL